jgi:hypothetical protein
MNNIPPLDSFSTLLPLLRAKKAELHVEISKRKWVRCWAGADGGVAGWTRDRMPPASGSIELGYRARDRSPKAETPSPVDRWTGAPASSGMVALAACFTELLHKWRVAMSYAVFSGIFELLVWG